MTARGRKGAVGGKGTDVDVRRGPKDTSSISGFAPLVTCCSMMLIAAFRLISLFREKHKQKKIKLPNK